MALGHDARRPEIVAREASSKASRKSGRSAHGPGATFISTHSAIELSLHPDHAHSTQTRKRTVKLGSGVAVSATNVPFGLMRRCVTAVSQPVLPGTGT